MWSLEIQKYTVFLWNIKYNSPPNFVQDFENPDGAVWHISNLVCKE